MYPKFVLTAAALAGAVVAASPGANAVSPHEKTYDVAPGSTVTVGVRDTQAHPVAALNGMPTNREVLLDSTFYGRVTGAGSGVLTTGYMVACLLEADPKGSADANLDGEIDADVGVHIEPGQVTPRIDVTAGPNLNGGLGVELELKPGKIADIASGSKDLRSDTVGSLLSRDFYIQVSGCAGALLVRPYAKILAKTADTDVTGAVLGDPITV